MMRVIAACVLLAPPLAARRSVPCAVFCRPLPTAHHPPLSPSLSRPRRSSRTTLRCVEQRYLQGLWRDGCRGRQPGASFACTPLRSAPAPPALPPHHTTCAERVCLQQGVLPAGPLRALRCRRRRRRPHTSAPLGAHAFSCVACRPLHADASCPCLSHCHPCALTHNPNSCAVQEHQDVRRDRARRERGRGQGGRAGGRHRG